MPRTEVVAVGLPACRARPGSIRRRASGRRRRLPRPEQGASSRTTSAHPGRTGKKRPSAATEAIPDRIDFAFRAMRRARLKRRSPATTLAPVLAIPVALPPGAAQISRTRSPGSPPTIATTSWLAGSCTYPSRRMWVVAGLFIASSAASVSARPMSAASRSIIQSG